MNRYEVSLAPTQLVLDTITADSWKAKKNGVYFFQGKQCVAYYPSVTSVRLQSPALVPVDVGGWGHTGPCAAGCTCSKAMSTRSTA